MPRQDDRSMRPRLYDADAVADVEKQKQQKPAITRDYDTLLPTPTQTIAKYSGDENDALALNFGLAPAIGAADHPLGSADIYTLDPTYECHCEVCRKGWSWLRCGIAGPDYTALKEGVTVRT